MAARVNIREKEREKGAEGEGKMLSTPPRPPFSLHVCV